MPRRRSRRSRGGLLHITGMWAKLFGLVILAGLALTLFRWAGWLALTTALTGGAYLLGRRTAGKALPRPQGRPRAARQATPGAAIPPARAQSISGPPVASIQIETTAGLRGLGWSATAAKSATSGAIAAILSDPSRTLTTETALRTALASADRSQAVKPGSDAAGQ